MLTARNRLFRCAAAVYAVAVLVLGVAEAILTERYFHQRTYGGVESGEAIRAVGAFVGAVGWGTVASAFDPEIDWPRLRIGAGIVAAGLFVVFAGTFLQEVPILGHSTPHGYRHYFIFFTLSELLVFVAGAVALSGLADSLRGPRRAWRLRLGALVAATGSLSATVSLLFLHSYFARYPIPEAQKIGLTVATVGAFGSAIAAAVFARRATAPLASRESALYGAGSIAVAATLAIGLGEGLQAVGYHEAGYTGSYIVTFWMVVGYRVVAAIAFALLALGARRAAPPSVAVDPL
jgi:hypothetical protein